MNTPGVRLPFRTVLASIAGLWLCYFLLTTLRGVIVGLEMQDELLWRRALVSLAGVGVTLLLWLFLRLFDNRSLGVKVMAALLAAMPSALVIAQVNQSAFHSIEAQVQEKMGERRGLAIRRDEAGNILVDVARSKGGDNADEGEEGAPQSILVAPAPTSLDLWRQVFDIALGRYFLLLAWAALYLAMLAGAQAQEAHRREERFRTAAKAAELRSLRYQVNPHFLFNAFNSLSALVMTNKSERAEEMIQSLSRFYRHSLADDPTADMSLEDEFDLQRQYLEIEKVRFPDRLRTAYELPDDLSECRVPGMILQPLVENSVKYGVSTSNRPVTVTLTAREEYGRLVLTVADDGPGAKPHVNGGFGIGLANVRDRLAARFGNAASITSGPALDGYETELRIPMVRHA